MGTFTPNIGLYIPAAGETNYSDAFAAGMMNLDSHDHSGGPNKGLPISSTGLGNFSVTFEKLAANVADITTGIGVNNTVGLQHQLQILGVLRNLFTFASTGGGTGIIAVNGSTVFGRTLQDSLDGSITWTFPDGVGGNPLPAFNIAGISPVPVANGGTGKTIFNPWDIICGGATGTGPLQQVAGEGTIGQYLGSGGPGELPVWSSFPAPVTQTVFQATVTMSAAQFRALSGTPVLIVAPQGAGKVIVPTTAIGKVNVGSSSFGGGSAVGFYYGVGLVAQSYVRFDSGTFDSSTSGYYQPTFSSPSSSGIDVANMENLGLYISVNSSNFTGGGTSTVVITVFYSVIQI